MRNPLFHRILLLAILQSFFSLVSDTATAQNLLSDRRTREATSRRYRSVEHNVDRKIPGSRNDSLKAVYCYLEGLSLFLDGKVRKAGKHFRDALEYDLARYNSSFREKCLNRLALTSRTTHHLEDAWDAYLKSMCIAESRGDSAAMMSCMLGLYQCEAGVTCNEQDVLQLMSYFHLHSNLKDEFGCLELLSAAALLRKDMPGFNKYVADIERVCRELNYPFGLAYAKLMKAEGLLGNGYFTEAREATREATAFCTDVNLEMIGNGCKVLQAVNYIRTGTGLDEAERLLEESLRFARISGFDELIPYIKAQQLKIKSPSAVPENEDPLALCHIISLADQNVRNEIMAELAQYEPVVQNDDKSVSGSAFYTFLLSLAMLIISALLSAGLLFFLKTGYLPAAALRQNPGSGEAEVRTDDEDERMVNLYSMILDRMREEKPYLDPDFSLSVLSTMLNRSERYISLAIRNTGGTNFNRLVIGFRVEEACRLIRKYGPLITMNEVGERSGFSNRMSFTRRFRELTGMSPTEYLDSYARK